MTIVAPTPDSGSQVSQVSRRAQSALLNQRTPRALLNQRTPRAVLNQRTPRALLDQRTPRAVLDQRTPRALLKQRTPRAVLDRRSPRALLNQRAVRGVRELALVTLLYVAYSATRLVADDAFGPAAARAADLLHLEGLLGIRWEKPLNTLFVEVDWLGLVGSYWYATAHYVVTAAVLVWLYRRGPTTYLPARRALLIATVAGLALYLLLPMAPPRLTGGYVDVLSLHSADGWWGADASAPRGLGGLTNQLAAFPSLHAGWALWVALAVRSATRNRAVRGLGWMHAAVTAVVIVGTGNHWVLDAVVGWMLVVLAWQARNLVVGTGRSRPRLGVRRADSV